MSWSRDGQERYLTINEVSQYLNVKPSTLYLWAKSGKMPHYRLNRMVRFRKADIDTWMESHRSESIEKSKKVSGFLKVMNKPRMNIDSLVKKSIDEVKGNRYTPSHRETRPIRDLRKEVSDGTL
jgi:excisionase family DNA binding protein